MNWTTTITGVYPQPGGQVQIAAVMVSEDQTRKEVVEVLVSEAATDTEVDASLRKARADLDGADALKARIPLGVRDIDATVVPSTPPTEAEVARQQFAADKARLATLQQEVDLGIRKGDDTVVADLKAALAAAVDAGITVVAVPVR